MSKTQLLYGVLAEKRQKRTVETSFNVNNPPRQFHSPSPRNKYNLISLLHFQKGRRGLRPPLLKNQEIILVHNISYVWGLGMNRRKNITVLARELYCFSHQVKRKTTSSILRDSPFYLCHLKEWEIPYIWSLVRISCTYNASTPSLPCHPSQKGKECQTLLSSPSNNTKPPSSPFSGG